MIGVSLVLGSLAVSAGAQQVSFWTSATVPATVTDPDTNAVELGMRFVSSAAGTITGIRFYKGPQNTGTHVGHLWSDAGSLLASVTFTNETATGWEQANLATPYTLQPNTTYIVSYYCPSGHYSANPGYFNSALTSGPLTAPQSTSANPNGVYVYHSSHFPTNTYNSTNYWVDVVFTPNPSGPSQPIYTISGTVTGAPATLTLAGASAASTTTTSSGAFSFSGLANGAYVIVPGYAGYSFSPSTAAVTISNGNISGVNFKATANPVQHSVLLSWTASTSNNIQGYKVYRSTVSGGPYSLVTSSPVTTTSFTDSSVSSGAAYFYVTTAIDSNKNESGYSNQATAIIPTP
jgi:hypothetical protein